MDLADRVVVLREGLVEQIGSPAALQADPASAFVFDFLGDSNRLPCEVRDGIALFDGFSAPARGPDSAETTTAWFRPHDAELSRDGPGLAVTVSNVLRRGAVVRFECRARDGRLLEVDRPAGEADAELRRGAAVRLRPQRVFVFQV
jgi:sulfate transport system ATP-binding protein